MTFCLGINVQEGLVGIAGHGPVNQALYDALTVLQHRGQDAAGIMTFDGSALYSRKANGLVRDVFEQGHMLTLRGNLGNSYRTGRPVNLAELVDDRSSRRGGAEGGERRKGADALHAGRSPVRA